MTASVAPMRPAALAWIGSLLVLTGSLVTAQAACEFSVADTLRVGDDVVSFGDLIATGQDGLFGLDCTDITDPACSCTGMSFYWTSTTFADFPAHALTVRMNLGLVGDLPKTDRVFVRAVRGGR